MGRAIVDPQPSERSGGAAGQQTGPDGLDGRDPQAGLAGGLAGTGRGINTDVVFCRLCRTTQRHGVTARQPVALR